MESRMNLIEYPIVAICDLADNDEPDSDEVVERRKLVEDYNNSLPQRKWFDAEFEMEMSIGIGGIYDSEYMNFIYDNILSKRIRTMLKKMGINKNKKAK